MDFGNSGLQTWPLTKLITRKFRVKVPWKYTSAINPNWDFNNTGIYCKLRACNTTNLPLKWYLTFNISEIILIRNGPNNLCPPCIVIGLVLLIFICNDSAIEVTFLGGKSTVSNQLATIKNISFIYYTKCFGHSIMPFGHPMKKKYFINNFLIIAITLNNEF